MTFPLPPPGARWPKALHRRARELSVENRSHPMLTLKPKAPLTAIWSATCRVIAGKDTGSGFLVDGGPEGPVVVTNAHVGRWTYQSSE